MSVVQNNSRTTQRGGVTGAGFMPGQSGNPGGRPKGLNRRLRELVGDDGHEIAEYMFSVLSDETQRTVDRMEAGKWLADRGFGRAVQALEVGVNQVTMEDLFRGFSGEDLEALLAIYGKYDVPALVESGAVTVGIPASPASRRR